MFRRFFTDPVIVRPHFRLFQIFRRVPMPYYFPVLFFCRRFYKIFRKPFKPVFVELQPARVAVTEFPHRLQLIAREISAGDNDMMMYAPRPRLFRDVNVLHFGLAAAFDAAKIVLDVPLRVIDGRRHIIIGIRKCNREIIGGEIRVEQIRHPVKRVLLIQLSLNFTRDLKAFISLPPR